MDIKQLARQRIAEAEAAIAAAGKSAMSTYQSDSFRSDVANPVPWASTHEKRMAQPKQFPASFAERLKLHEAHLNALKQASKKPPLPSSSSAPTAHPRTYTSISDPSASYLPPWSQPHHMPTFHRTPQSDSFLTSGKSFEGSRVSTAGSAATIGWAGPWVVTHRQNGPDRMYPAKLRPGAPCEANPSYTPDGSTLDRGGAMNAPMAPHPNAACNQSATQPTSVEWMLPHHRAQVPPAAQPRAAPVASANPSAFPGSQSSFAGAAKQRHGIPSPPAACSPPGGSGRVVGSQIPSPARNMAQQQDQRRDTYRTAIPDGEGRSTHAAVSRRADAQADLSVQAPHRRGQRGPVPEHAPPFPIPATQHDQASRRVADSEDVQRQHMQSDGAPLAQLASSQQALARLAKGQRPSRLSHPASDPKAGRDGAKEAAAAVTHPASRPRVACDLSSRAPADAGAGVTSSSCNSRSRRDAAEEPCLDGHSPHERQAELSAPMARLKRMLRTRGSDSSAALPTVEERPLESAAPGQTTRGTGSAGALAAHAPRVLQQSPTKLASQNSIRKLAARQAVAKGEASARALQPRQGSRSTDEQPAVAQSGHVDFEAMVELKMREEAAAADGAENRRECGTCGRHFAASVLAKHEAVCAKAAATKRAPMDMTRKRLTGVVDNAGVLERRKGGKKKGSRRAALDPLSKQTGPGQNAVAANGSRGQAWKRKSDAFRAAMRANREVNAARLRGEDITKLPVFEDEHDDRVPCPHCGRKFAPLTAERHIPKCKDIRAKPKFLKRGSGAAAGKGRQTLR